ncbi:angiopoietin-like protein 8 [Trichechus inunguis]
MPVLALCLLWTLVTVPQPVLAAPTGSPEPAQHEELTLLFHGTLQLGQALNSVYRTTEARLTEAGRSLDLYGHTLGLLGKEVSRGQAAAQELHTGLLEIQMEENALQLHAEAMAQTLGEVAQTQQVLQDKVQQLEVRLQGTRLGNARHEFEALKVRGSQPWDAGTLIPSQNLPGTLNLESHRPLG